MPSLFVRKVPSEVVASPRLLQLYNLELNVRAVHRPQAF